MFCADPANVLMEEGRLSRMEFCLYQVKDKYTQALRDFNAHVMQDSRITLSIVPVGDGMALCRKR